jgi:putative ABC transport system permease protein
MASPIILRAAGGMIRTLSLFAPAWRRADWRREWLAELHFGASRLASERQLSRWAQVRLLARCSGAVFHVIWLWKHEWSLDMFTQDVRYGVRMLRRRPAFAIVSVLTLALGIGATTAIFSAVRAILLAPLPYPRPERLVKVYGFDTRRETPTVANLSVPDVVDFVRHTSSLEALGAHNSGGYFTLTGLGEAERVPRLLVTSGYFRVLGASAARGRLFAQEEDRPSPPDVVVVSDGFWRRRLGADPDAVGRSITLGGSPGTIIGVLPAGFVHPDPAIESAPEIFALLDPDPDMSGRGGRYVRAIARLKQDRALEQAESELRALAATLAKEYPKSNTGRSVLLRPLAAAVAGDMRAPLLLLQGATCAILLIVCANLANLLLAAGTGRTGELAVRTALGASRGRIVRQLLTEGLVLAGAGGVLGVALSWWGTSALSTLGALPEFHRRDIAIDPLVLAFSLLISLGAGLVFGLLPTVQVAGAAGSAHLRDTPRHTGGPAGRRLRSGLVVAEVAMSVMLLVGAALLIRSFWHLTRVDPGFHAGEVLSFQLSLSPSRHPDGTQHAAYARLYDRLRALPGVDSVGAVNILPLSGNYSCDGVQIAGREVPVGQESCAEARSASPDYFRTMGIELVRGRVFADRDHAEARRVVVINETMARQFFPGEHPVGRAIIYSARRQNDSREIVGIIRDVHHFGLDRDAAPEFYVPQAQPPSYGGMTVVMRVRGDAAALVPAVRGSVRELDSDAPMYNVRTLNDLLKGSLADARLRTTLLASFAALALLLAVMGTYGVMSVAVTQRGREMGVRLALGATPSHLVRLVVGQGVRPILAGTMLGLLAGYLLSQAVAGMLFQVKPGDPATFAAASAVIVLAGLGAAWLPARRACRVDPAVALRPE